MHHIHKRLKIVKLPLHNYHLFSVCPSECFLAYGNKKKSEQGLKGECKGTEFKVLYPYHI